MELKELQRVYAHEGPFAAVYLEARSPGEDSETQNRLRWKALRERLESQGATEQALDAAEQALARDPAGEEQADGRVLVASADDGVVLDERWDAALGTGDDAHWGVLPELGAYVREQARSVRILLVSADQEGAQLRELVVAQEHVPVERNGEEVEGTGIETPHHVREGALAHRRIQRRADEAVQRNAKEVAAAIDRARTRFAPDVVLLAGEVQGRTAVREQLSTAASELLVETGSGGSDEAGAQQALTDEVLRVAGEHEKRRAADELSRLREGQAHDRGTMGDPEVLRAAEVGALDTLLLEPGVPASREALLVKSASETGASLELVPTGTGLEDGVGGVLRFPPMGEVAE